MFVEFETFDNKYQPTRKIKINANLVLMVIEIEIPSSSGLVEGPDKRPVMTVVAGLDFGFKIIPVNCSMKEAEDRLEGKISIEGNELCKGV